MMPPENVLINVPGFQTLATRGPAVEAAASKFTINNLQFTLSFRVQ